MTASRSCGCDISRESAHKRLRRHTRPRGNRRACSCDATIYNPNRPLSVSKTPAEASRSRGVLSALSERQRWAHAHAHTVPGKPDGLRPWSGCSNSSSRRAASGYVRCGHADCCTHACGPVRSAGMRSCGVMGFAAGRLPPGTSRLTAAAKPGPARFGCWLHATHLPSSMSTNYLSAQADICARMRLVWDM